MRRRSAQPLRGETIALFGAGGLARALAPALRGAGARLVVWSRSRASLRGARRASSAGAALEAATGIWLAVPDDALAPLARELARCGPGRGRIALHSSGLCELDVLAPLARSGWRTGWAHPLLPLPRSGSRAALRGTWFATGGAARGMVQALGGRELRLRRGSKADYHLAATLVSNGALALFELARAHVERAARDPRAARAAFAALLAATAANLARSSPRAALTGPVARGDLESLRAHLAHLRTREQRELYRALGRVLLALAGTRLPPSRRRALAQLLGPRRPR